MSKYITRKIQIHPTAADVSAAAAELFVNLAAAAANAHRPFRVALSGGTTPRQLYELLATPRYSAAIPWKIVEVFWGDERFVSPNSVDSNYRLAKDALLDKVPLSVAKIHPMATLPLTPPAAAAAYEATITEAFALSQGQLPRFDLVLLGLGPDGHTASLFPATDALTVNDRLVAANFIPKLDTWRLTLTLPVINNAAEIVFLAVGEAKAPVLRTILAATPDSPLAYPAQMVQPTDGRLRYLVDAAAASI